MLFSGCRQIVRQERIITYAPEIMMEQIILSSHIYHASTNKLQLSDKPTLIYRYSGAMCQTCVYEDIFELRDFQEKTGKENILVLPAFPDNRDNRVRLSHELADFNYRNIPADSLIIPVQEPEGAKRYFAVIGEDGKIEMVFFPKKGHPAVTRSYFAAVEERLKELCKN
jgi:peroxiredoxin